MPFNSVPHSVNQFCKLVWVYLVFLFCCSIHVSEIISTTKYGLRPNYHRSHSLQAGLNFCVQLFVLSTPTTKTDSNFLPLRNYSPT
ncbi:hypothetical protein EUGRSUZ_A01183 [Eucalyptus grandis]|uniref:Uncharacterized protein n=2 Tax=Eucalyptus grandis TaxID=71139 RepID=A0A059DEM7_EUCGR|nr:hypothetical protein EUGRSUZ_A01183 [Eucalyptus grandis]